MLEAEIKVINIDKLLKNSTESFNQVVEFYNFTVNQKEKIPGQFFDIWWGFIGDFNKVFREKLREIEKAK